MGNAINTKVVDSDIHGCSRATFAALFGLASREAAELDRIVDDAEAAKARGDWRLYGQLAAVAGAILAGRAEPVRR